MSRDWNDNDDEQGINLWSIVILTLGLLFIFMIFEYYTAPDNSEWAYSQFINEIEKEQKFFDKINIHEGEQIIVTGFYFESNPATEPVKPREFWSVVPRVNYGKLVDLLQKRQLAYGIRPQQSFSWTFFFFWIIVTSAIFWIYWKRRNQNALSYRNLNIPESFKENFPFIKNRANSATSPGTSQTTSNYLNRKTFADVAGVDEAKEELQEIVDFLRKPEKFLDIGAQIPKGVLLMGPPGTGKTLLARAIAGEAGVKFFSAGGSGFVEMFVGVGARRVRDLFEQARKDVPCIVFIDEVDTVGRRRDSVVGSHHEHDQTLNQLLSEMDGFEPNSGVIVIAATNRPDVLDPALLRPGRFDRRVVVSMPDMEGRSAILKIHTIKVNLAADIDLHEIARGTVGFSGADLANLINEAALRAARNYKSEVDEEDLEWAKEKVVAGPERKKARVNEKDRRIIALHEAGHAILARAIPDADPPHKISIIPRGLAGGLTWQLPKEDRLLETKLGLEARIAVLMAGRAAEEIGIGKESVSTGAGNDFERATSIARNMVCRWGLGTKNLGPRTFGENESRFLGQVAYENKNYSDAIAKEIDAEIRQILKTQMDRSSKILNHNKDTLIALSERLLESETLDITGLNEFFCEHPIKNPC